MVQSPIYNNHHSTSLYPKRKLIALETQTQIFFQFRFLFSANPLPSKEYKYNDWLRLFRRWIGRTKRAIVIGVDTLAIHDATRAYTTNRLEPTVSDLRSR